MKITKAENIMISTIFSRQKAEKLLQFMLTDKDFQTEAADIQHQLQNIYVYKIKCCGCGHKHDCNSYQPLSVEQIKYKEVYFLCDSCYNSEDFK